MDMSRLDTFRTAAFYLTAWQAVLAALSALILMVVYRGDLTLALMIGANVALVFALLLIARAVRVDPDRIERTEPWQVLSAAERPSGYPGRRWAAGMFAELQLRFAKGASGLAIVLCVSALTLAS